MKFSEKENLIKKGKQLLGCVTEKNFGLDIIQDVMNEQHIEELKAWLLDVEEFVEKYGLECQKEHFNENNWIINQDERVSVKRIENILSIIERIEI